MNFIRDGMINALLKIVKVNIYYLKNKDIFTCSSFRREDSLEVGTDLDRVATEEGSQDSLVGERLAEEGIRLGTKERHQQGLGIRVLLDSQRATGDMLRVEMGTTGQGKVVEGMGSEEDSLAVEDILQEGNQQGDILWEDKLMVDTEDKQVAKP